MNLINFIFKTSSSTIYKKYCNNWEPSQWNWKFQVYCSDVFLWITCLSKTSINSLTSTSSYLPKTKLKLYSSFLVCQGTVWQNVTVLHPSLFYQPLACKPPLLFSTNFFLDNSSCALAELLNWRKGFKWREDSQNVHSLF